MLARNKNVKRSNKKSHKKQWVVTFVVLGILLLAVGGYAWHNAQKPTPVVSSRAESTKLENSIDKKVTDQKGSSLSGSSPSSQPSAGETKQATGDSSAGFGNQSTQTANVTPEITYFGSSGQVNAFVPTIVENGGTCTLTITNGGTTIFTKTQPANANAQSTTCMPFTFNTTGATSNWQAVVTYNSSTHSGASKPFNYTPTY